MQPAPDELGGDRVLLYSPIDDRHRPTAATKHLVAGVLQPPAKGLAICAIGNGDGFFLFGCDARWDTITDTWHASIEEAQEQAEFEYEGVSRTWVIRNSGEGTR